jgi:hypothetical protein
LSPTIAEGIFIVNGIFEAVQRAHVLGPLRLRDIGEAIEPDRLAGARDLVGEVTRRFDQGPVGENLLLQFL